MQSLETKRVDPGVDLQWKVVDAEQGIIQGYLSVFNNVDSKKDRVRSGAYQKTIQESLQRKEQRGKKYLWPLLWMHDPEKPIGGFTDAKEDTYGLLVTAQLDISTNAQGVPNNPLAVLVFSGFKHGYIDELSIGYKALQKSYDQDGIRDLAEIQLFEGSAVTMLFASNPDAQVTSVKTASGGDFPLASRNTRWSKSKAMKDIEAETSGDWSKASKYFFWSSAHPTTEADHKLPFVAKVDGSMKAIPEAIISAAGVLQGAMGGAKGLDDREGVRARIAHYYQLMGMTPPWKDEEKRQMPDQEQKDFQDYYRQRQIADWLNRWFSLTQALKSAVMDAFNVGDQPYQDVQDALSGSQDQPGFTHALMDWVNEGIALNVSQYFKEPDADDLLSYMSRAERPSTKAGAVVSQDNKERLQGHVNTLMEMKDMLHTVAEDITHYITGNEAYVNTPDADGSKTAELRHEETDLEQFATWLQSQVKSVNAS